MTLLSCAPMTKIPKGWGEEIFLYHLPQELEAQKIKVDTVKILRFEKGKKCSFHFHNEKSEYFIIISGCLDIKITDKEQNVILKEALFAYDRVFVPAGYIHQMFAVEDTILLEISTLDHPDDSIRIIKGD